MPKYRRVTYEDRCQISALLKIGIKPVEISKRLRFDKSTISREIKRNQAVKGYLALAAEDKAKVRKRSCIRKPKITSELAELMKQKLILTWSPEQISGRFKREGMANISTPTIYRFVNEREELRCYLRMYKRRGAGRYLQRKNRPNWERSIEARPKIAAKRARLGDWERDTLYAKGGLVLVCADRKSRMMLIRKVKVRTAKGVAALTSSMLKSTNKKSYTMTNDNGSEFRGSIKIGVPIFYCKPMRPQQRGTVENLIGQLRRFIPRKADLNNIHSSQIKQYERILNGKPRKCLDYKTPYEVYYP